MKQHSTPRVDDRYKWKVLASVLFGIFMVILDTTVVNVAFPTLRQEFGAGIAQSQWIISIYVLCLGISTPLAGFMADRYGLKRTYIAGLAVFLAGSILSALAVGLPSLIAARAIQAGIILLPLAISAGITLPLAGRLYDRVGPRPLLFVGFSLLVLNTSQLMQLEAETPIRWIAGLLVLRGLALGLTVQTTFVTALSVVPLNEIARGSSLTMATRQVVQSIGVAILAQACRESLAGFARAYRLTLGFAVVALGLGLLMPGWPGAWSGRRSTPAVVT